jgi:hypothetical protein
MAIIRYTAPIDELRGTTGTTTYTSGLSGPFAKRWRSPAKRHTLPQASSRALLAAFAANWRHLTGDQQSAWNDYAADPAQEKTNSLGLPYYLNGLMWYVAINAQLSACALSPRADPPDTAAPSTPTITSATVYWPHPPPHLSRIDFPEDEFQDLYLIAFIHSAPGPGRSTATNNWLLLIHTQVAYPDHEFIDAELDQVLGDFAPGQRLFFRCARQDSQGQRSPAADLYTDVLP